MFGVKVILAVVLIVACTGFCIFWDSSVQPDIATAQSHNQLQLLTNGQGDKLANERRAVTRVYHWPTNTACGLTAVIVLLMFVPNMLTAAEKATRSVNKSLE